MVYGLELLAGVRTGEASALRWRHYDPVVRPLGRLSGWFALVGRAPTADDLIVPLPPDAAERRRSRTGLEPFRGTNYSGLLWREPDLPALGWRHRRHYDMRATFITLAIEDGDVRRGGEAADQSRRAARGCLGRRRVGFAKARCSVCKL